MPYTNNKGADQPAHPFVVRCLDSLISLVSISKISSLYLASVAKQAGLSLIWSQTPKTRFLVPRLVYEVVFGESFVVVRTLFPVVQSASKTKLSVFEPLHDKTSKMAYAPSEDSDQPGHPPSLIRVFAVRMKKVHVLRYPLSAAQERLIRLGGCPG